MLRAGITSASKAQKAPVPRDVWLRRFNAMQDMGAGHATIETHSHPDESKHSRLIAVMDRKRFSQRFKHRYAAGMASVRFDHIHGQIYRPIYKGLHRPRVNAQCSKGLEH